MRVLRHEWYPYNTCISTYLECCTVFKLYPDKKLKIAILMIKWSWVIWNSTGSKLHFNFCKWELEWRWNLLKIYSYCFPLQASNNVLPIQTEKTYNQVIFVSGLWIQTWHPIFYSKPTKTDNYTLKRLLILTFVERNFCNIYNKTSIRHLCKWNRSGSRLNVSAKISVHQWTN